MTEPDRRTPVGVVAGRSLGKLPRRVLISTVALTAVVMALVAVVVQLILGDEVDRNVDRALNTRANAVIATVQSGGSGSDAVEDSAGRLGALVFDSTGRLRSGSVPRDLAHTVEQLRSTRVRRTIDIDESVRVLGVPFHAPSGTNVVVVAEPLSPYERAESYALWVTIALGILVTAGAGILAAAVVRRSLAPVGVMSRRADEWSEHDLTRRFELGSPNNELTALGGTLDHLLDRVAVALQTERRLTGEIAHELRTPVTAILASADLALLDPELSEEHRTTLEEIAAAGRRLESTISTLVELARTPGALAEERTTVGEVLGELELPADAHTCSAQHDVEVAAPRRLVERTLNPLLDNAARFGQQVWIDVEVEQAAVRFAVRDDGPGLSGRDPFLPSTASAKGLGLALSRRIARSVGGDVTHEPAQQGARFVARFPRP